jgi:hypothetical protein
MPHTTLKQLAVALVALGLSAQPVFAQHRRTSAGRDAGRSSAAEAARPSQSRSSGSFRAVERGGGDQNGGRFEGSRRVEAAPRVPPSVQTAPQAPATSRGELRSRIAVPRAGVAVPRGSVTPANPYTPRYEPRYQPRYTEPRYQPRYVPRYAPNYRVYRYTYRPFARPYYSFRSTSNRIPIRIPRSVIRPTASMPTSAA